MAENTNDWAFAAMLTGGILILVGGLTMGMMTGVGLFGGGFMGMGSMMSGYGYDWAWMGWWMGGISVVTGGAVLVAAGRLRLGAAERSRAGMIAIVAGALSLLAMGGWIFGAALAVLGGVLALTTVPTASSPAGVS